MHNFIDNNYHHIFNNTKQHILIIVTMTNIMRRRSMREKETFIADAINSADSKAQYDEHVINIAVRQYKA